MTRRARRTIPWAFLILLISVPLTAAGNLIAGRYALDSFSPTQANALRYLVALAILVPIMRRWPRPVRSELPVLACTGLLGVCIYNILFFNALQLMSVAEAGLLEMIIPAASLILAWIFLRERLGSRQVIGVVVGWFGIVWLVKILPPGTIASKTTGEWRGEIFMTAAVLIFAVYSVTGKSAMRRLPPPAVATWSCIFGTIPLVLLAAPAFISDPRILTDASLSSWLGVVYGGAVGFVYNIIAWYYCFRRIGVARTNLFLYLVPIFGAALAVPIFNETLTGWQIFGSAVTLFGIVLATVQLSKRETGEEPPADAITQLASEKKSDATGARRPPAGPGQPPGPPARAQPPARRASRDARKGELMLTSTAARDVLARLEDRSDSERSELDALNALGAAHTRAAAPRLMLDVGPAVGRLLNTLVRVTQARRVVEIGGSVGYSTIWLAEAAAETGGEVVSIEKDSGKAKELTQNVGEAGLLEHVRVICESADGVLPGLPGPFDLVLIDHWKDRYVREFDLAWPKVRVGGVVVADNILLPRATAPQMEAYVQHVRGLPDARSHTIPLGDGVEITVRAAAQAV